MFLTIMAASLVPAVDGKAAAPTSDNDPPRSWFRQERDRNRHEAGVKRLKEAETLDDLTQ
jgi:hypothetical protein